MIPLYKRNIKFVRIECKHCGFDQILFTRATTKIKCFECRKVLTIPKGGKCELVNSKVVEDLR